MINNSHVGSSLDDFLEEDGILAEVNAIALKSVLAWQILQEMEKKGAEQISNGGVYEHKSIIP